MIVQFTTGGNEFTSPRPDHAGPFDRSHSFVKRSMENNPRCKASDRTS